jgi:hypothetical protein
MKRQCIGFGPLEGICTAKAGTQWTHLWCESCDEARREHISRRMVELETQLIERAKRND